MSASILGHQVTEVSAPVTRPVQCFEVCRSNSVDPEPWLFIGELLDPPRGRPKRNRRTFVDTGFAVLDLGLLIFPVAPRWRIHVNDERLRVRVDGEPFVDVNLAAIPRDWLETLNAEGMAWVVSGAGLTLSANDPLSVLRPAIDVGLAVGGLVLVD